MDLPSAVSFRLLDVDARGWLAWSELQRTLRLATHHAHVFLPAPDLDQLARHTMLAREREHVSVACM